MSPIALVKLFALTFATPGLLSAQAFVHFSLPAGSSSGSGAPVKAIAKSIDASGTQATIWFEGGADVATALWRGESTGATELVPDVDRGRITRNGNMVYGTLPGFSALTTYSTETKVTTVHDVNFQPTSANADGSMLGGGHVPRNFTATFQATYTPSGGIRTLQIETTFGSSYVSGYVSGLSADGRYASSTAGVLRVFDSAQNTFVSVAPAADFVSRSLFDYAVGAISDDGNTALGTSLSSTITGPYQSHGWAYVRDELGGFLQFPDLPDGYIYSHFSSLSADGSLAAGWMRTEDGERVGVVWDLLYNKVVTASEFMGAYAPGSDWTLLEINAISANGSWIVGEGLKDGVLSAWGFVAIPEPSAYGVIAGLGVAGVAMMRRRPRAVEQGRVV